jgi:nitrate/nitrite transporter NarK
MSRVLESRWWLLFTLWFLFGSATAYHIIPASVLSVVSEGLGVTPGVASWLVSAPFLAMSLFAIPVGALLDRLDNRRMIGGAAVLLLATMGWGWLAATRGAFTSLLVSRFIAGIGLITVWTASVNLLATAFPGRERATAIGVMATSPLTGYAAGQFVGPLVTVRSGWPAIFLAVAAGTAVAFGCFWIGTLAWEFEPPAGGPSLADFGAVLTHRAVLLLSVLAFIALSLNLFYNNWLPTYIADRFAVSLESSGALAALFPAIGITARASSGLLSDRLFDHRRRPVLLLSFLVSAPLTLAIGLTTSVTLLLVLLVVVGYFVQVGLALLFTYVQEVVTDDIAGTALAVLNAAAFFGAFSAPIISGLLIDRSEYTAAFLYIGGLALVGVVLAWRAPEVTASPSTK